MTDPTAAAIAKLEHDYAVHKQNFEKWKLENARLSGNPSYNQYVQKFIAWERGAQQQLRELKETVARKQQQLRPVGGGSIGIPGGAAGQQLETLEQRLEAALRDVSPTDFMMAVFAVGQKDPGFLMKMFEVVERESAGTGFANPLIPQRTSTGTHPTLPSSMPIPPGVGLLSPAGAHTTRSYGGHPLMPQRVGELAPPPLVYSQMTPYGMVPEGWVVEPPIAKHSPRPSSPPRQYRNPSNLPFRDFSQ